MTQSSTVLQGLCILYSQHQELKIFQLLQLTCVLLVCEDIDKPIIQFKIAPNRPRCSNCNSFQADQTKDSRNETACINCDLINHNKGTRYISNYQPSHPDCPAYKETHTLERQRIDALLGKIVNQFAPPPPSSQLTFLHHLPQQSQQPLHHQIHPLISPVTQLQQHQSPYYAHSLLPLRTEFSQDQQDNSSKHNRNSKLRPDETRESSPSEKSNNSNKRLSFEPVSNCNQSYKQRIDNLRLSSSLGDSSRSRLRGGIAGKGSDSKNCK